MSMLVLLAIPDVGLVWCGTKSTTEEVSKKVEQAVLMLNRYTTNTCTLPILYRQYTDTYCRYYRGWLLTNSWLIHPLIKLLIDSRPTLDRHLIDISPDTWSIYQLICQLTLARYSTDISTDVTVDTSYKTRHKLPDIYQSNVTARHLL